jgi:hypothetical protein
MGNPFKSLLRLLRDSSVSKIEISAGPPFAKMIFDKAELQALLQGQSRIADLVAQCFVRRRVFWQDIAAEDPTYVLESLEQVESELNQLASQLSASTEQSVLTLARFVRSWATASSLVRKELRDTLSDIAQEKALVLGYDSAGEDRQTALQVALVALRQRVYPLVTILVAFLSDEDPTKGEAQAFLDRGLNLVPDAKIQRESMPEVDEASV